MRSLRGCRLPFASFFLGITTAHALAAPVSTLHCSSRGLHMPSAGSSSISSHAPRSVRDEVLEQLSNEVFSKGNQHWKNVDALTSLPEGLHSYPEVCFIGKPNVGKSTLISCLLHNSRLAKGGKTPGTTRLLQFFNVGGALQIVDTPGYGGWKNRQLDNRLQTRANAFAILFRYLALRKSSGLKRVYWLMEASATTPVSIQPREEEMLSFLSREGIPFSIILTKIDRHMRYYKEQHRSTAVVGKDGVLQPGNARSDNIATPEEGIRRNMEEIYEFFGNDSIPILAVSANRKQPARCQNLSLLQHDILHYCTQELKEVRRLTYKNLRELSYLPPLSEEIQKVQVKYPIESFMVPQDNNMSLEEMVQKHEEAKARFLGNATRFEFFTEKDAETNHLLDSRRVHEEEMQDDHYRQLVGEVPPSMGLLSPDEDVSETSRTIHEGAEEQHHLIGELPPTPATATGALAEGNAVVVKASQTVPHTAPDPLPVALDLAAQYVTAINGVRIPRSLVMPSLETLAITKDDELPAFAMQSGAGAYEELLMKDHSAYNPRAPDVFMEHQAAAGLSEEELDSLQRVHVKSVSRKQKERLLSKYIDKDRKDRSIYMQAEGYMCPWLAGAGQSRCAVHGAGQQSTGRGGALVKGLKDSGFGGRSYSDRTMRNRGRATKKTGTWAT